jgi:SAM-dependent methyltransferase
MNAPTVPYDEVADWYEHDFLVTQRSLGVDGFADRLGIDRSLAELLGAGTGTCLEIGCGTGIYADRVRQLGRIPIGVDVSAGMLRHATGRLPIALSDATTLAVATASVPAVIAVMVHTDMVDYPTVLAEAFRVLSPGGVFVHVGVHPCFCGGFADRSDLDAIIIKPGYLDGAWTTDSWTDRGVRDKVGAVHYPLAELLNTLTATGFVLEEFAEGAEPTPVTLAIRARKP